MTWDGVASVSDGSDVRNEKSASCFEFAVARGNETCFLCRSKIEAGSPMGAYELFSNQIIYKHPDGQCSRGDGGWVQSLV